MTMHYQNPIPTFSYNKLKLWKIALNYHFTNVPKVGGNYIIVRTSSLNQTIIRTDKEAKMLAELFHV